MKLTRKESMTLTSFVAFFLSIPFVLNIDQVKAMPHLYQAVMALFLPLVILVVTVSYLTGQAKIDVKAIAGTSDAKDLP